MIAETLSRTNSNDIENVDGRPAESLCRPGQGLTVTELFRVLDALRRRVALETRGLEGAFAGFDSLDISRWRDSAEAAPVLFTARVVSDQGSNQVVEYQATRCSHTDGICHRDPAGDPYATANGRTVGLRRERSITAGVRRFSIASPNR